MNALPGSETSVLANTFTQEALLMYLSIEPKPGKFGKTENPKDQHGVLPETDAARIHRKWRILIVGATWGFLTSVERSIILPTMWFYFCSVWTKDAAIAYYGVTLTAFGIAILLFTPIFGSLSTWGVNVKLLVILANIVEIFGNLIYVVAPMPFLLPIARFICGIGVSIEPSLYADLICATVPSERTFGIIFLLTFRQIGLLFGPAFTLVFSTVSFSLGQVSVNVYNGVGLLMALLWLIHTLLVVIIYPSQSNFFKYCMSRNCISWHEHINHNKVSDSYKDRFKRAVKRVFTCKVTWPCLTIFLIVFGSYFSIMGLEAVLSPLVNKHFGWNEIQISIVYVCSSVLMLLDCGLLYLISKYYEDRHLLLGSIVLLICAYAWQTVVTSFIPDLSQSVGISLLLIGLTMHILGIPFVLTLSESLYTKLIPEEQSTQAQSLLRTVINLACLIGPALGGCLIESPFVVFFIMLVLIALPCPVLIRYYSNFKQPLQKAKTHADEAEQNTNDFQNEESIK